MALNSQAEPCCGEDCPGCNDLTEHFYLELESIPNISDINFDYSHLTNVDSPILSSEDIDKNLHMPCPNQSEFQPPPVWLSTRLAISQVYLI